MIAPFLQQQILELVRQKTGSAVSSVQFNAVSGGSINHTYEIRTNNSVKFFCKINSQSKFPGLFEAEQRGLELLQAQKLVRVPQVIGSMVAEGNQVLVLQWIEQGMRTKEFWKLFGKQLAALHNVTETVFGLPADNYMGSLRQYNHQHDKWNKFFIGQRLQPQVKMAVDNGLLSGQEASDFEKVYIKLKHLFPFANPRLLHGDLWNGNFLCDEDGRPVLIDPAVYYGHPAVDLGMTTLFGGFDKAFYESYHHFMPFPPNYREQWEVCNLYPLLIHLNLFGLSYKPAIMHTITRY